MANVAFLESSVQQKKMLAGCWLFALKSLIAYPASHDEHSLNNNASLHGDPPDIQHGNSLIKPYSSHGLASTTDSSSSLF